MNTYYTDITTQRIQIEGIFYTHWEIAMIRMNIPTDKQSFRQELFTFLSEWFNHQPTVLVHTSGSTGKPKPMRVEKESMMESACLTCIIRKSKCSRILKRKVHFTKRNV